MDIKRFFRAMGIDMWILLAFACGMFYMSARDFVVSLKPIISFEDMLNGEELKVGSHVEGNVPFIIDYFATETSTTKYKDGSTRSSKNGRYYLIPTATGYVGLKGREVDVSELGKITDETYEYLMGGPEPTTEKYMTGVVDPMDDELAGYFYEYLEDMGYTQSELDAMGEPLVIKFVSFTAVRIMFAISIFLLILTVFLIIRKYKKEGQGSGLKRAEDLPSQRIEL
ncbi:MAG: hypothetical protein HFI33_09160 [Lachnospiraceae bacterium]|nr:hypothetical protein [Lachnospiraceae bacterium]